MAINKSQLRGLITDVLKEAGLYSRSAVELLMLTAAVESRLGTYIEQITGPALGIFQMEPRTHDDIWENYLEYKRELALAAGDAQQVDNSSSKQLRDNLRYAILMARIHYLRVPEPIPYGDDVKALAEYWKKYYNTYLGAGTVEKAINAYEELC